MINSQDREQRKNIFNTVNEYLNSRPKETFIPGKTWIRYAGRYFSNEEYLTMIDAVLDGWITEGRYAEEFEFELSKYLGTYSTILVNSGSSANLIALTSLTSPLLENGQIKKGDEVITTASGFPTTVNPIIQNDLIPVFVDIEEGTYNINPELVETAISDRTRAIMVAHTLGNPFDVDAILKITKKYGLYLIEDNCDALGSEYDGKKTGSFGDFSTVSFYPAHHITMGEGGAVNTNDPTLERIARSFRDWGRDCYCKPGESNACGMRFTQKFGELPLGYDHKYVYSHIGYNLKVTDIQAALGVAQLRKVKDFVSKRKSNFMYILNKLKEYENQLSLPKISKKADPSWFAFPITVKANAGFARGKLVNFLEEKKIETRSLFAGNLIRHPAYLNVNKRIVSDLKVTDNVMSNSFFIGVYPGLTDGMLAYICDSFEQFMRKYK